MQALVDAVVARYDIPQRWYALKAKILGVDRLADYDRMASVATADVDDRLVGGHRDRARRVLVVLAASWPTSCSASSTRSGSTRRRARQAPRRVLRVHRAVAPPVRAAQLDRPARDVPTLAHELGHGLHAYLAREQGVFQLTTPLTLAETASVFGETVTSKRLLGTLDDPDERLALLAGDARGLDRHRVPPGRR